MKRSEMINKIGSKIYLELNPTLNEYNMALKLAEILLNEIEKLGMLPPIEPDRRIEDLDLGVPEWENE